MIINFSSLYHYIQKYWFVLFLIFLIIMTIMLLWPRPHMLTGFSYQDKVFHFLIFLIWATPVFITNPKSVKFIFIFMILYGGFIEVIQPYFNRSCDIVDFIANTLGVLFSYSACFIFKNKLSHNR